MQRGVDDIIDIGHVAAQLFVDHLAVIRAAFLAAGVFHDGDLRRLPRQDTRRGAVAVHRQHIARIQGIIAVVDDLAMQAVILPPDGGRNIQLRIFLRLNVEQLHLPCARGREGDGALFAQGVKITQRMHVRLGIVILFIIGIIRIGRLHQRVFAAADGDVFLLRNGYARHRGAAGAAVAADIINGIRRSRRLVQLHAAAHQAQHAHAAGRKQRQGQPHPLALIQALEEQIAAQARQQQENRNG